MSKSAVENVRMSLHFDDVLRLIERQILFAKYDLFEQV